MKAVAKRRFLQRKISKRVRGILAVYPDIGQCIENFVQERSVGADAWRRTGVLTFDGNSAVKEKVTYSRIQEHLQNIYKRKFAYGTVVQLCIARNKRRISASRYKGVAKVTSRRARKVSSCDTTDVLVLPKPKTSCVKNFLRYHARLFLRAEIRGVAR